MFGAVQLLKVLILTLLCVLLFYFSEVNLIATVWERAANSGYHLLFRCLLRYGCSSFPLMFRTKDKLWVQIRQVPKVSLLV